MASNDPLTGVSNRNQFFLLAEQVVHEAVRYSKPFSLAFIDLDNFKLVNDQNGHHEGDRALQVVASVMKSNLRQADIVARIGGDEFVVLLPESDYAMAKTALKKLQIMLRHEMEANDWPITFSIGAVACLNFRGTLAELLKLADSYLYCVKSQGKNNLRIESV
jgi:diguanylate cyclase (GGDEF)-like protein